MPDDVHNDDPDDALRTAAVALAQDALDSAPVHGGHRHGLMVGVALDPDDIAGTLTVIAVAQGLDEPIWIALDDDDLERIRAWLDRADQRAQARRVSNLVRLH